MGVSRDHASALDLNALDQTFRANDWALAFPPDLEERFEADIGLLRARRLSEGMPRTILIYNAFLIADLILLPDVFSVSLFMHFGIVTPVLLGVMVLLRQRPTAAARELSIGLLMTAIVAGIIVTTFASRSPNADHYQYLVVVAVLYFNVILRPAFPNAVAITCVLTSLHVLALLINPAMTLPVAVMVAIVLAGTTYVSLLGTHQAERQTRRNYLRRLRDDVTTEQLSRDNVALERMARIDPLTGLANRRGIEHRIQRLLEDPVHVGCAFALLVVDVDHFKAFNDRHGHAEGDRCLETVAAALRAALQDGAAILGRVGGEEFVTILPGATLEDGGGAAERLRAAVERLAITHGATSSGCVTVSIGVAEDRISTPTAFVEAFQRADTALYAAKRRGRNRVHTTGSSVPRSVA